MKKISFAPSTIYRACRKAIFMVLLHGGLCAFGTTLSWAYSLVGYKWSSGYVNYYVNSSVSSSWRTAVTSSDATWDSAGSKFRFYYKGTKSNGLACDNYNMVTTFKDGNTGAIATTVLAAVNGSYVTEIDAYFNTYYSFSTSGSSSAYDIQNTMTHEFGHWLVLNDLSSPNSPSYCGTSSESTMCGSASKGETRKRSLATDDKNGIKAIYGS